MFPAKSPVCSSCKHIKLYASPPGCKAFKVIPKEIWFFGKSHNKVIPGQKEPVVFEKSEKEWI